MRIKFFLLTCMFLLSAHSYASTILPADLFAEIRSEANMQQGDILYVDFWASWCNPCRKSFPWMNAMHQKFQDRGFKILAINVDKERALADNFLSRVAAKFPVLYDPLGRLAKSFQLKGMPSSFMIDDKGTVRIAHTGFFEAKIADYENEIQSLLMN